MRRRRRGSAEIIRSTSARRFFAAGAIRHFPSHPEHEDRDKPVAGFWGISIAACWLDSLSAALTADFFIRFTVPSTSEL